MASFNLDMEKYIDKINLATNTRPMSPIKKKRPKSKKLAALLKLKDTIKMLLDADEIISFADMSEKNNLTVYEKKTLMDKLGDFVHQSKSVKVGVDIEKENSKNVIPEEQVFKGTQESQEEFTSRFSNPKQVVKIEEVGHGPMNSVMNIISKADKKIHERDIPKRRVERVMRKSSIRDENYYLRDQGLSEKQEFREDLREIIRIMYKIIKNVPPEALKNFRESEDYSQFVKILDNYDLIKK